MKLAQRLKKLGIRPADARKIIVGVGSLAASPCAAELFALIGYWQTRPLRRLGQRAEILANTAPSRTAACVWK
jgi:hypothetical protein